MRSRPRQSRDEAETWDIVSAELGFGAATQETVLGADSASRGLKDSSQVDTLGSRCKSVNFGAGKSLVSTKWWAEPAFESQLYLEDALQSPCLAFLGAEA